MYGTSVQVSKQAKRVFTFLLDNRNLTTTISGGMSGAITGLDKYKLAEVGKGYNINIYRYLFAIKMFENGLLKLQEERMKKDG